MSLARRRRVKSNFINIGIKDKRPVILAHFSIICHELNDIIQRIIILQGQPVCLQQIFCRNVIIFGKVNFPAIVQMAGKNRYIPIHGDNFALVISYLVIFCGINGLRFFLFRHSLHQIRVGRTDINTSQRLNTGCIVGQCIRNQQLHIFSGANQCTTLVIQGFGL